MKNLLFLIFGSVFVFLWTSKAHAVAYWNCSSPTGPATGTWNQTGLNWTTSGSYANVSPSGGPTDPNPVSWNTGLSADAVAFCNGTAANGIPGAYTVTVDNSQGQIQSGDFLVYCGPLTLAGGTLDFDVIINNSPSASSDAGLVLTIHTNQVAYVNVVLTNSVGPYTTTFGSGDVRNVFANKQDEGVLYLGATNTFIGDIAVKSGVLGIACDQSIPSASSLILLNDSDIGGGADQVQDILPVFNTGGHNQTLNQLVMEGPNSLVPRTIDFQNGLGTLWFAGDSSTNLWNSSPSIVFGDSNPGPLTLVITNYILGVTKLRFGTDATGLTTNQLGQINFAHYGNAPGKIDALGFVTPAVPYITSITKNSNSATLVWQSIVGMTYTVQYKNNLTDASWNVLTSTVGASGSSTSYIDTTATASKRFYEVVQNP
jgi:autotransporter-associated beta strand protein